MDINRWIITGWRGSGKTMFCQELIDKSKLANRDIAGIISPGSFLNDVKQSFEAMDIRTGRTEPLANLLRQDPSDFEFGDWFFNIRTLEWGNRVFQSSVPCEMLVVDELGPLELVFSQGWVKALDVIRSGQYRLALIVIRPELLELAQNLFNPTAVIHLDNPEEVSSMVEEYSQKIRKILD